MVLYKADFDHFENQPAGYEDCEELSVVRLAPPDTLAGEEEDDDGGQHEAGLLSPSSEQCSLSLSVSRLLSPLLALTWV